MESIKLVCPGCCARYIIKAQSLASLGQKRFNCPKCGYTNVLSQLFSNFSTNYPRTKIGGQEIYPNSTPTINGLQTPNISVELTVEGSGKKITLMPGRYTLGRDSADSQAIIRLAPDRYMSRLHAELEYTIVSQNGAHVSLRSLNPKNPILVNGVPIDVNGRVGIRNGDQIVMGDTTVNVKIF